jgi:hypothetical protein
VGTASINDERGAGIGDDNVDPSVAANIVLGAPTTGGTLGGKMLESMELNDNQ